jgi:hypothetical protein
VTGFLLIFLHGFFPIAEAASCLLRAIEQNLCQCVAAHAGYAVMEAFDRPENLANRG